MKLPPCGKAVSKHRAQLLAQGLCPEIMAVYVGAGCWAHKNDDPPALCVPLPFEPGLYDWDPIIGLPVAVHWLDGEFNEVAPAVAEIARAAAPVTVLCPSEASFDAAEFLLTARQCWSVADVDDYARRAGEYFNAVAMDLGEVKLNDEQSNGQR